MADSKNVETKRAQILASMRQRQKELGLSDTKLGELACKGPDAVKQQLAKPDSNPTLVTLLSYAEHLNGTLVFMTNEQITRYQDANVDFLRNNIEMLDKQILGLIQSNEAKDALIAEKMEQQKTMVSQIAAMQKRIDQQNDDIHRKDAFLLEQSQRLIELYDRLLSKN